MDLFTHRLTESEARALERLLVACARNNTCCDFARTGQPDPCPICEAYIGCTDQPGLVDDVDDMEARCAVRT